MIAIGLSKEHLGILLVLHYGPVEGLLSQSVGSYVVAQALIKMNSVVESFHGASGLLSVRRHYLPILFPFSQLQRISCVEDLIRHGI